MKITGIRTFTFWVDWCNWLLVRIDTDEGLYGWGEGSLHGSIKAVETAVHELSAYLIGKDPLGPERHWQGMYHAWRWRGGAVLMTALAALDLALWDIEGKRLGVPVYRLLGGPYREQVPCYASHWLAGIETPAEAEEGAREAVRRGFSAFKWSPFRADLLRENEARAMRRAVELMEAARAGAGPDTEILIECSELLSPRTALMAARALLPYRPYWFEEPIPFENARVMARLQRELPVPIATGERLLSRWEFRELLEEQGCRIIQPDLMHAAGITECRRIATLADTYYVSVAPHNSGGPIATLAAIHLAAAIPNFLILEQMENEREMRARICTDPPIIENGCFRLPTRPGLGTDIRLEVVEELAFRPQPVSHQTASLWR
ncbi:MAG: galactonate dehydratase [Chloroflexi bacterium]|nr:galactonate dehydratase [Chloroflexota bacterium]